MTRIFDTFLAGGIIMWPLLSLSVVTFACALERSWFWYKQAVQEKHIARDLLAAAKLDFNIAYGLAERAKQSAVARFLAAPLKLKNPTPETFHLAIQAASDREYVDMRQGDKLLESVMAIAPLLGILGTALGLITTFTSLKNGQVNGTNIDVVVAGIGQALISSATGLTVAIIAFVFYRIFRTLRSRQIDFFSKVGSELELIYLQIWHQPDKSTSIKLSGNSFTEAE